MTEHWSPWVMQLLEKAEMGKRGPKPREGRRYPCGQLDRRTTQDRLNEMSRKEIEDNISVARNHPHRRGSLDPAMGVAAGRFCRRNGLGQDVLDGCAEWYNAERRWLAGYGAPRGYERHDGGSGVGPTKELMDRWLGKMRKAEQAIVPHYGLQVFNAARSLVVDDVDIGFKDERVLASALCDMAVALDCLSKNPHPYLGGMNKPVEKLNAQ